MGVYDLEIDRILRRNPLESVKTAGRCRPLLRRLGRSPEQTLPAIISALLTCAPNLVFSSYLSLALSKGVALLVRQSK